MTWEQTASDKKSRIDKTIPKEWLLKSKISDVSVMHVPVESGILSKEELAITESTAVDLVARMAAGELKSVDVTTAFCKRAALAHQLVANTRCS